MTGKEIHDIAQQGLRNFGFELRDIPEQSIAELASAQATFWREGDVSADPWDNYLLAMAKGGAAEYLSLATSMSFGSFAHARSLTAGQFLALLGVKKRIPSRGVVATRRRKRNTLR